VKTVPRPVARKSHPASSRSRSASASRCGINLELGFGMAGLRAGGVGKAQV
jgi:hypothetical protein